MIIAKNTQNKNHRAYREREKRDRLTELYKQINELCKDKQIIMAL